MRDYREVTIVLGDDHGGALWWVDEEDVPEPPHGVEGTGPYDVTIILAGGGGILFPGTEHGTTPSVPIPFVISLGGHSYQIDTKYYTRAFIDPFREARDTGPLPGEQTLNPQGAWKRTRDDWSLGAGQHWSDRTESSERRYWNSKGIDVWERYEASLLPDAALFSPTAADNLHILSVGGYLYVSEGTTLRWSTDPDAEPFAWDDFHQFNEEITDITTDGAHVYVATEGSLWSAELGAAPAIMAGAAATHDADVLEFTNGWLFAAKNNVLSEIRADGTVNEVMTHSNPGFVFAAVAGSPSWIYAGGQAADVNEIYKLSVAFDGRLAIPIYAGALPRGEMLRAMLYAPARMTLGTSIGVGIATIDSDGGLSLGPRIDLKVDVRTLWHEGAFVWFGWTNFDLISTGVGRLNLSEFTFPEVPAYASDLMLLGGTGAVAAVARHGDRTYFAVDGTGFVRQIDAYCPTGYMDVGRYRWGTFEPKVFLGVEVVHLELEGSIEVSLERDTGDVVRIGRQEDGGTGLGQVLGVGALTTPSDWFAPTITMGRSDFDDEQCPVIHRFTVRALPIPKQVEQIRLPIVLHSLVNVGVGEGQDQMYDTFKEYVFLRSLRRDALPVQFQQGVESFLVTVRNVEWAEGLAYRWNATRTALEGVVMVTCITTET